MILFLIRIAQIGIVIVALVFVCGMFLVVVGGWHWGLFTVTLSIPDRIFLFIALHLLAFSYAFLVWAISKVVDVEIATLKHIAVAKKAQQTKNDEGRGET